MERPETDAAEIQDESGDMSEIKEKAAPDSDARICVIVAGMHRSGTSMITRLLNMGGVGLPSDLVGATKDNPTGHWEPSFLNARNQNFLEEIGSDWSDWAALDFDRLPLEACSAYEADVRAWLDAEIAAGATVAVKEPRLCRLLPPFLRAADAQGVEVRALIPFRNPLEVARSLKTRDGIPLRTGVLLWLRHVLDAEFHTRGLPRSFVDYADALEDSAQATTRVLQDLTLDCQASALPEGSEPFASRDHRHHAADEAMLAGLDFTAGMALEAYRHLGDLCKYPRLEAAEQGLDALRTQLDEVEHLTLPVTRALEGDLARTTASLETLQEDHHRLNDAHQEMTRNVQGIWDLHDAISALNKNNEAYINDLTAQLSTKRAEHEAALAQLDAKRREHEATLSQMTKVLAQRDETIHALYASRSWRITAPIRAVTQSAGPIRRGLVKLGRKGWQALPLSQSRKNRIKDIVLPRLGFLLGSTGVYQGWQQARAQQENIAAQLDVLRRNDLDETPDAALVPETVTYVETPAPIPLADPKARLIAFYLPQFHPIPENDEWWGEGFTEWTNVQPATPKFPGHYQPHEPIDLGHYNLLDTATQARQIELAKLHGLGGFCFYWYWFAGKRLLEKPVENWLAHPELDFPFCICWANENWSRRWDGLDHELLIGQDHSPEDDLAFIEELAPYLRDTRYIRIDGKPLVLLYRPSLLPDAAATADRWRTWCRENGIGEIYLAYTQSFESNDPAEYGFDAAIEFPPNNFAPDNLTERVDGKAEDFTGIIYDWRSYLHRSFDYPTQAYRLFRSVCPSWDNTARRKGNGTIFANSTPAGYRTWLENAVTQTLIEAPTPDERVIFVNAWNEWAEGAHLEPDTKYGYGLLEATRAGLNPAELPRDITLVGHDAHPHGAQMLLLNLARFYAHSGLRVRIILLSGGELIEAYREHARVTVLQDVPEADRHTLLRQLRREHDQVAIVNTTVSAALLPALKKAGYRTVQLVHEMASVHKQMGLAPLVDLANTHADKLVFPAPIVAEHFKDQTDAPLSDHVIRPQGLYAHGCLTTPQDAKERALKRAELGFSDDTTVLLGVGYIDHRKGADLFVEALAHLHEAGRKVAGLWVGAADTTVLDAVKTLASKRGVIEQIQFTGRTSDVRPFFDAADVFLLTSREDPYPSVTLESMARKLPCVMFSGVTGSELLADKGLAVAVPTEDTAAMASAIADLLDEPAKTADMVAAAHDHVQQEADFGSYAVDLLSLTRRSVPKVSVIVPNYNYADYIEARLDSVLAQDFPIYEIIVLDDCSTDDSLARIRDYAARAHRYIRVVPNAENSGNVFRQWIKGAGMARGDYLWIAEADDLAKPDFLSTAMRGFEHKDTVISYTDSVQIDENGSVLAQDYRYYTDPIDSEKWTRSYVQKGSDEIAEALFLKNTIPNVSGAVMATAPLKEILSEKRTELESVRFVGDWLVYLWLLERGDICYSATSKNVHRRHSNSVTISNFDAAQYDEIAKVQSDVQASFNLGSKHQSRAKAYLDELAAQFGLEERA